MSFDRHRGATVDAGSIQTMIAGKGKMVDWEVGYPVLVMGDDLAPEAGRLEAVLVGARDDARVTPHAGLEVVDEARGDIGGRVHGTTM
jgi:hypothetical protein